jgi:hypothetical protein
MEKLDVLANVLIHAANLGKPNCSARIGKAKAKRGVSDNPNPGACALAETAPSCDMSAPGSGDVMLRRDDASTYFVVDADTKAIILGPFDRQSFAIGVAQSVAYRRGGHVMTGLHYDLAEIESKLLDAQSRVDALARECRDRARELAGVVPMPRRHSASSQGDN